MSSADRREPIGTSPHWLRTWPRRYAFALITVAVATLLRVALGKLLGPNLPFIVFYPVIWLVAWMAGLGPGVFAVSLSAVSAQYLFFAPANPLVLGLPQNANGLIPFSTAGIALGGLADMYRRRAKRLQEFEKAVEGLEEMVAVVDRNYRYVMANRVFLKYRGMKKEDLIGRGRGSIEPGSL
jgi:K+-sensing histidine kinase KdpD